MMLTARWRVPAAAMLGERRAQATVEMAVVVPVMLVMALIVYNLMVFLAATARFDRVAPDIVMAHGVAPVSNDATAGDGSDEVRAQLVQAMRDYDVEIEVSCEVGDDGEDGPLLGLVGALRTYRCVMRFKPWPSGLSIAGVSMGAPVALVHGRSVTVDPWRSGVLV